MADNQRVDELLLRITEDKASISRAKNAISQFRQSTEKDVEKLKTSLNSTATISAKLNTELGKLAQQKKVDKLVDEVKKAKRGTDEWFKALQNVTKELQRIGASDSQIAGVAGGIASGGRQQISAGLGRFGREARTLLPAIPLGGGVSSEAITKVIGVIGSLPVAMAPVLIAVAALGAGFVFLETQMAGAKKALDSATEANKAYFELLGSGTTTQDAKKRLEDLNTTIKAQQTELATIQGAFASGFKDAQNQFGDAGAKVLTLLTQVSSADDKLTGRAQELTTSLADNQATAERLRAEIDKGSFSANDLADAQSELTKAQEDANKALEQLAAQRNSLLQNEGQQVQQLTEDRIVADLRELEDWNQQRAEQLERHNDTLLKIDADGQKRLEQIRESGLDRIAKIDGTIADLNKNLAKIDDDGASKRQDLNSEFMRDEITELEKFRKEESRRTRDYYKDRERLLEDLNNTQLDAEKENDVNAFIQAQQAADIELRRNQEDFDQATQDRQNDFLAERQLEQQRLAERIADINTEADTRRADLQERIAEQQIAKAQVLQDIADQMNAERARILQSKIDQQAAFDEQQQKDKEAFDKRQQREAEDEARSDLRRANALAAQLADIAKKEEAERLAVDAIIVKMNQLRLAAGGFSIAAPTTGTSNGTNSSYYNPGSGGGPVAFGYGGMVTQPTIALMGERPGYGDVVRPFRKSEGPQSAFNGAGGSSMIINLNGDIGNLTRAEVTAELQKLGQTIVKAKWQARTGAAA